MSHRPGSTPFVIVGGGVAGVAAATTLRQEGFGGRVVLVSDEHAMPYRRSPLTKGYLRGESSREDLLIHRREWYRDAGVDLLLGARATRLDRARKVLEVRGHGTFGYDRLVVATGARQQEPTLPGAFVVRTIADADAVRDAARTARDAVVVGAGYAGSEIASSLAWLGLRVTLLGRRSAPVPLLGSSAGAWLASRAARVGIDVRANVGPVAVEGRGPRRTITAGPVTLEADLVVQATGAAPRVRLARDAGLAVADGVLVDTHARSSDPDIAVAGDAARFAGPTTGTHVRVGHEATAAGLGVLAARTLLDRSSGPIDMPRYTTELFGVELQVTGFPDLADEVVELESGDQRALWVYGRDGRLIAAAGVGVAPRLRGS